MSELNLKTLCTALGFAAVVMQGNMIPKKDSALRAANLARLIEEFCLEIAFNDVRIVDGESIVNYFRRACVEITAPVISIDRVYVPKVFGQGFNGYLDVTRAVNEKFEEIGLIRRIDDKGSDTPCIEYLDDTVKKLSPRYSGQTVTLVDDVVFSGGTVVKIVKALNGVGISVGSVVAGISIGGAKSVLANEGIDLKSAHHFESVVDEVCCRDFIVGAPYGGRTIVTNKPAVGDGLLPQILHVPYLLPFGRPEKWATIPQEKCLPFSLAMLTISANVWKKIQDMNGRDLSTREMSNQVWGLPERPSVVAAILEIRDSLRP